MYEILWFAAPSVRNESTASLAVARSPRFSSRTPDILISLKKIWVRFEPFASTSAGLPLRLPRVFLRSARECTVGERVQGTAKEQLEARTLPHVGADFGERPPHLSLAESHPSKRLKCPRLRFDGNR
jgi:hypothetical protein